MRTFITLFSLLLLSGCGWQQRVPTVQTFDELPYPFPAQKVKLESGEEIAYFDQGEGQPIIFIHGLGSYAPAWKNNIEGLQENFRCIALDLPGYGKSSKGKYEASMTYYATIVKNFMQALGLEKAVLAGHSMGGQIAMTTALAYPNMVERLVLVAPAGFERFHKGEKEWFRQVLTPTAVKLTTVDQIKENIAWNFYDMPEDAEFMITDRIAMRDAEGFDAYCYIIPECVKGMVDEPVFEFLPQLEQPALVIFGHQDNLIPNRFLNGGETEAIARQGVEQLPDAQLRMVDKAGHFVHFERSETVNAEIRRFLE
ncbi:MAG TPA: alpha/beta fold hydrolase [Phaeodactylibacter sp.]|nr:alpha/beta fold hydrolase [Phaeodactylibacter sp.]